MQTRGMGLGAHERDALYALGYSDEEQGRLIAGDRSYGPATSQLFRDAGIGPGMRVLDVGCGVGDVSFRAAELVGPDGAVVGIDADPRALQTARARAEAVGFSQVSFHNGDLRTLPAGELFDAAVGRLILMYLGDPVDALRTLAGHLRPGGVVAFHEMVCDIPPHVPDLPQTSRAFQWIRGAFGGAGMDLHMGLKLSSVFEDAGLPAPELRVDTMVLRGADSPLYEWIAGTVRSVLPFLERSGQATAAEVDIDTLADRMRAEVAAARGLAFMPPFVGAWARKPAA